MSHRPKYPYIVLQFLFAAFEGSQSHRFALCWFLTRVIVGLFTRFESHGDSFSPFATSYFDSNIS